MVVNDPLKVEDLIEPFRAEFERCRAEYRKHYRINYDWQFVKALSEAAERLLIAEQHGPFAAVLWEPSN